MMSAGDGWVSPPPMSARLRPPLLPLSQSNADKLLAAARGALQGQD
ncbi:MAG: hypothetical protein JWR49_3830 [Tardiphaga sp.]|jgi:hypothetical protein|nr:hypothetical protein [Tardiphaga sp.]